MVLGWALSLISYSDVVSSVSSVSGLVEVSASMYSSCDVSVLARLRSNATSCSSCSRSNHIIGFLLSLPLVRVTWQCSPQICFGVVMARFEPKTVGRH